MRHLNSLFELKSADVENIFELARSLKKRLERGERPQVLSGFVMSQVFEKPSLRTRLSFDAAMTSTEVTARKLKSGKPTNGVDIRDALVEVRKAVTAIAAKSAALQGGSASVAAEVARLNREIEELEGRKLLAGRTGLIQEYAAALRVEFRFRRVRTSEHA